MKEFYTAQIERNQRVTEESLTTFKNKHYHSGREIKVGDLVLFALVQEKDSGNEITMTLIALHEDEIDNYHVIQQGLLTPLPLVELKPE
jgi:hypothetical protein